MRARRRNHELGCRWRITNVRRDERCGAVRDWNHRVVDVDLPRCTSGGIQNRRNTRASTASIYSSASFAGCLRGIPNNGDNQDVKANAMKKNRAKEEPLVSHERRPRRVRLPGFISDDEFGLGDVIKRATYAMGIKPCGGCERRAAALNRWMVFSGKRRNF